MDVVKAKSVSVRIRPILVQLGYALVRVCMLICFSHVQSSNYHTIALISHASQVMLRILQARLQQNMNRELPDVQAGFRNGRGTRDQIANKRVPEKHVFLQESSRKTSISALLTMPKPLTVWIITNCGKFWKRWEYQTTWPASWETCIQVRKQQLELDMEQQSGSK